jgi:ElaB/YqjD/DUF883 family membrane-anchored ribosome-binding protein
MKKKTSVRIITPRLMVTGLLAVATFVSVEQKTLAAEPPTDPAHAAHVAATASQAGEKITDARQKIERSLIEGKKAVADAEKTFVKKSKECAEIADDYVRENPWSAIGMAAGLGVVLGLLIRGK